MFHLRRNTCLSINKKLSLDLIAPCSAEIYKRGFLNTVHNCACVINATCISLL